jgi:hypothetical protein
MTLTTYDLDGRALGCTTDGETKYRNSCMKLVIATVTILKRRGVLPGDRVDKKKYGVVIGLGGPTREQIEQHLARKRRRLTANTIAVDQFAATGAVTPNCAVTPKVIHNI